jgi:hypothetical protein
MAACFHSKLTASIYSFYKWTVSLNVINFICSLNTDISPNAAVLRKSEILKACIGSNPVLDFKTIYGG